VTSLEPLADDQAVLGNDGADRHEMAITSCPLAADAQERDHREQSCTDSSPVAQQFDKQDVPRSAGPRRAGLWGAIQLGTAIGAAALRPAAGAARLGRRAAAQALDGVTLATADLVLNSKAAGEVVDRLADSPLFERAVSRALAGPLVEAVSRDVVRYAVLDRVAETILRGDALESVLEQVDAAEVPRRVVDRMLIDGIVEQTATRIVNGPELERAVETVLESAAAERLVGQVIESKLLDEAVRRLLESEELWLLVEEIARSPAVTEAITQQSMGFADQVADGVRGRSRRADVWLERAARRALRRDTAEDLPDEPAAPGVTPP